MKAGPRATAASSVGTERSRRRLRLIGVAIAGACVLGGALFWWHAFAAYNGEEAKLRAEPALVAVACRSSHCAAAGANAGGGVIEMSSDGGRTWSKPHGIGGAVSLTGVSCASAARCVAVGSGRTFGVIATGSGSHWSILHTNYAPEAVSCPTTTTCLIDGVAHHDVGVIEVSTDGGHSWVRRSRPPGMAFRSVSCSPGGGLCIAGGATERTARGIVAVSTNLGVSWSIQGFTAARFGIWGAACRSSSLCVVVGPLFSAETVDAGQSWSTAGGGKDHLYSVACSSTTCVAGGAGIGGRDSFAIAGGQPISRWTPAGSSRSANPTAVASPVDVAFYGIATSSSHWVAVGARRAGAGPETGWLATAPSAAGPWKIRPLAGGSLLRAVQAELSDLSMGPELIVIGLWLIAGGFIISAMIKRRQRRLASRPLRLRRVA